MNSMVQVGQKRFINSVAVTARPAPSSPAVLQVLAQSIAALNGKVDALALGMSQPPARIMVESREVEPMFPATRRTFGPSVTRRTQLPTQVPASPMAIDRLLDLLVQLNEKVTALERRSEQQIVASPVDYVPARAKPVEYTEPAPPPAAPRQLRVRRSGLLNFFE
jgi:hypothetical protein